MIRLIKLICCCCKKNSNGKRKVTNSVNKDQSLEYIPNSEGFRNNLINPSDDDYNSFESNKKSNKSMKNSYYKLNHCSMESFEIVDQIPVSNTLKISKNSYKRILNHKNEAFSEFPLYHNQCISLDKENTEENSKLELFHANSLKEPANHSIQEIKVKHSKDLKKNSNVRSFIRSVTPSKSLRTKIPFEAFNEEEEQIKNHKTSRKFDVKEYNELLHVNKQECIFMHFYQPLEVKSNSEEIKSYKKIEESKDEVQSYQSHKENNDEIEILPKKFEENKIDSIFGCFQCGQNLQSEEDYLKSSCNYCVYCETCTQKLFTENLNSLSNKPVSCKCNLPISHLMLKKYVPSDEINSYLMKISGSQFEFPEKIKCKCNYIQVIEMGKMIVFCESCEKIICTRCLEGHDENLSCWEYYRSNIKKCKICKINKKIELPCDCDACKKCYFESVKQQILDFPDKNPICPLCEVSIPKSKQHELFGGQNRFIDFQSDSFLTSRFTCPICYMYKVVDGCITLYCTDRFCSNCIRSYLESTLDNLSLHVTSVPCPICNKSISYFIIASLLSIESLNRYHRRLIKNTKAINSQEVLKFCNQCDFGAFVQIDIEKFDCPVCNKSICAKCNKPFTENCCRYESVNSMMSGSFKENLTKCPRCKSKIMKETGCNFLKCGWPECTGEYFCFLCNKELKLEDHYSHYKLTGPFGDSCNTLDRIKD